MSGVSKYIQASALPNVVVRFLLTILINDTIFDLTVLATHNK